ncbi:MAG TPA: MarR family transcriptional regulator [Candidatus Limnocylindria bacterium]|nr:MarR family transcriptional regulator [Candidatus Limnocylindria bacterium]
MTTHALEREAGSRLGLSLAEHHLLVQLARAGDEGMRASDLAARSLHTKSGLTRAVDRLVAQQLVERRGDSADGRVSRVRLTAKGRRAVLRAAPGHFRSIGAHFADLLSADELAVLTTALGRIAANR